VGQTLHVFYFYQVRYLVRKPRYFFLFWTNKLRFLAKIPHTVKSELKMKKLKIHYPFNLTGHSAVDAEVDRVRDADTDVDGKSYQVTLSL
jgi:hypothetical protein